MGGTSARRAGWRYVVVGALLASTACSLLDRAQVGAVDASDAGPADASGSADVAPLEDAGLPPPPSTCKKDGLVCVARAPDGWSGPFALYQGGVPAPSCASGTTSVLTANDGLVPVSPAVCGECTCQPATGLTCGQPEVRAGGNSANCSCTSPNSVFVSLGVCTQVIGGSLICDNVEADSVTIEPAPAAGGSCQPALAKPVTTKAPPVWNVAALGCQLSVPSQVDCPAGNVCAAEAAPPFNPKPCIMKAGDVPACPGFPYSKRSVFYRDVADTRDCTACTCGAAKSGVTCPTMAKTSANGDCSVRTLVAAPACQLRGIRKFVLATATPPTNLPCPPDGGAPTGTAVNADPVTVCCSE